MRKITFTYGGFNNAFRVMPGAGIAKTIEDVKALLKNKDITIIVFGSITVLGRNGNDGNQMYIDPKGEFTVNSVGMTNLGKEKYKTVLREIVELVHEAGKKLVVSIAAVQSYKEYSELLQFCIECGADGVELNFGCPNVVDGGTSHAIPSFDPENLRITLEYIENEFGGTVPIPVWVKISPLIHEHTMVRTVASSKPIEYTFALNKDLAKKVCDVLNGFNFIKAVVCCNTIGNVCALDETGKPMIGPNSNNPKNTGGLSGKAVHAISVRQTMFFRANLKPTIDIIGAGGNETGEDMDDFIRAGAAGIQVVSPYYRNKDPFVFSNIASLYVLLD